MRAASSRPVFLPSADQRPILGSESFVANFAAHRRSHDTEIDLGRSNLCAIVLKVRFSPLIALRYGFTRKNRFLNNR